MAYGDRSGIPQLNAVDDQLGTHRVKFGYLDEVKPVFPRSTAGQGINDCSRCAALNRESWLYKQTQSVKFGCGAAPLATDRTSGALVQILPRHRAEP